MNVALENAKYSPKAGFGKIPDRPSFAKSAALKSTAAAANAPATASLRNTASTSISTSARSSVFSTRGKSNASSTFMPATRFMVASDFKRDRTTTAAWGSIQGDHYKEGQTGVTDRSYRRMYEAAYGQQQQNCGKYTNFGNSYNQQMSPMQFLNELGTTVNSIVGMFKSSGTQSTAASEKGGPTATTAASAAVKTAQTLAGNLGNIVTADNTIDLKAAISESKTQQADLQNLLESSDYQNVDANLDTAKDTKTKMDTAVKEQQGVVANQQKSVDLLSGTRIPAQQTVVSNAEAALKQAQNSKGPDGLPNDAAIKSAESALTQAKSDLQKLEGQLKTAKETRDAAKAKLEGGEGLLAQQKAADGDVTTLTALKSDKETKSTQLYNLAETIGKAEQREGKMLKNEENRLDDLFKDLQKLDTKIAGEKDESKKAKLKQEYAQLAGNFTSLAGKTTSEKYANASINGGSTFSEDQNATLQANLQKMKAASDNMNPSRPELT